MSTVALSRNPSITVAEDKRAGFVNPIWRLLRTLARIGRDRRKLQTVPDYLLADIGLERTEIRTSIGDHEVWIGPRRR